ncbi:hypothetical protein [Salmonella enterica]|uniref:hypothetical protein n=1 Tax=Salmonella enterica TaxID=28901 RepID=UPI00237FCE49|nr:hypothetical protein [Salmonella enterica]
MSSLIFYTDEAQALIVTDTLAVTDNGEPLSFVSKAGYIPQLRTIIAGTGAGGFSNTWLLEASTRKQRAIQATYSHPERIHIGGEMIAHYLTSSMYQCFKIGEFEDFRTQGEYILSRI